MISGGKKDKFEMIFSFVLTCFFTYVALNFPLAISVCDLPYIYSNIDLNCFIKLLDESGVIDSKLKLKLTKQLINVNY